MSIIAKHAFTEELKERLSDKLTLKDINAVLGSVTEQLDSYDMERTNSGEGQQGFNEMLELFLEAKRVEGRADSTIKHYRYVINKYRKTDDTPIRDITVYNLRQFLASEKDRGLADSTLKGFRETFSSFFGWLHREGLLRLNPCANMGPIKCKQEVRKPYSEIDLALLKESCITQRDKAMISLLLSTGCRVGEVCGLNRSDIDLQTLECTVLGKGNKERVVYIDSVTAMHLKLYLDSRKNNEEALFLNRYGNRIHAGGIQKRLRKLAGIVGVQDVYPHRFRRTLATYLINHGMPIQEVASLLGHERIETTMKYYYLDKRTVKNSYQRYM